MNAPARSSPAALLIMACAFWGGATVLNKALLASAPPLVLLTLQLAASIVALWIVVAVKRAPLPSARHLIPLLALGLLNPGVAYSLSLMGLARVSASMTTLLWASEPLLIVPLAAFLLREAVTWRFIAVLALGLLGVALVVGLIGGLTSGNSDAGGVILLLLGVLCCALYTVLSRALVGVADSLPIVAIQQSAGALYATAALALGTRFGSIHELVALPPATFATAVISGLLYYAAAYWLYLTALRFVPAGVAGAYFNVIPVFGVGFAAIFLGETLTHSQWLGALLIGLSVIGLARLTPELPAPTAT